MAAEPGFRSGCDIPDLHNHSQADIPDAADLKGHAAIE